MNRNEASVSPDHRFQSTWKHIACILILALVSIPAAADDQKDPDRLELSKLNGTWQLLSAIKDGKETDAEIVKKIKIVIKDGKHTVYFGDDVVAKEIPFAIDVDKDPKTTTDTLPDGKTIKGIYKLDDDKLTSCVASVDKDRPTEFSSKAGTGHTLRVFTRVKQ